MSLFLRVFKMNERSQAYLYWHLCVIPKVLVLKPHVPAVVLKKEVPHPILAGFKRRPGALKGQIGNYGLWIGDKEIHIEEYEDRYEVHWDMYNPETHPVEHFLYDSTELFLACVVCTVLGAMIGERLSKDKRIGKAVGAAIGLLGGIFIGSVLCEREPAIYII